MKFLLSKKELISNSIPWIRDIAKSLFSILLQRPLTNINSFKIH